MIVKTARNPSIGLGVFCNQPGIKKGDFIIEYVGEVIADAEFQKRLKEYKG